MIGRPIFDKITVRTCRAKLFTLAGLLGWNVERRWQTANGPSVVGYIYIENPAPGAYRLVQITNEQGGEKDITGVGNIRQLHAWLCGADYAALHVKAGIALRDMA